MPCPYPHSGRVRPVSQEQYDRLTRAGRTGMPRLRPTFAQHLIRLPDGAIRRLSDEPTCLW